jgi:extradiol dioxygenase family protein
VDRLKRHNAVFINEPEVKQKGTVREQMLMTLDDGCGNAIEFKGLHKITDVYAVEERETAKA